MIKEYILTDKDVTIVDGVITACTYDFEQNYDQYYDGTKLIIPETIGGQTIIGIGTSEDECGVFYYQKIAAVQFPPLVQIIGKNAFHGDYLEKVDFSNCSALITICQRAFDDNPITEVDFSGCTALTTLEQMAFPEHNVISAVGLADCSALISVGRKAINCPTAARQHTLTTEDVIIQDGVITDCTYDFKRNFFGTALIIPKKIGNQTVIAIGSGKGKYGVFSYKDIVSVQFPPLIQTIGMRAFSNNRIGAVNFSNCKALTTIGNRAFISNKILTVDFSNCNALTTIGREAFISNKILTVDFTNCTALTTIGRESFSKNEIKEVDFSSCSSLIEICEAAFYGNPISKIDFSGCTALTTIERIAFPEHYEIRVAGLAECSALISVRESALHYPAMAVQHTLTAENVEIKDGIITHCSYDFKRNLFGTALIIPEQIGSQTVIGIGHKTENIGVFKSKNIVSVQLPDLIQSIENEAFMCNKIMAVDFSNCKALTTIGRRAFMLNKINTVNFTDCMALTTIGEVAFAYNPYLKDPDFYPNTEVRDAFKASKKMSIKQFEEFLRNK